MDIILFILLLLAWGAAVYGYFMCPAFRKSVNGVWSSFVQWASGNSRPRGARAKAQASCGQNKSAHPASRRPQPTPASDDSLQGVSMTAMEKGMGQLTEIIREISRENSELKGQMAAVCQRLDVLERQLTLQRPPMPSPNGQVAQPTPQPASRPIAPATRTVALPLAPGRTYYAMSAGSRQPLGFRTEDWNPVRTAHSVYAMTVLPSGEADFTIDEKGLPTVLNALSFYKDTVDYVPVDPHPNNYVPLPGRLCYAGGVWKVVKRIRLEGRA